jgi:probable addiction module antidote protein
MVAIRKHAFELGIAKLASKTGLARETLYRTLGEHGNPRLLTLTKLCAALGLRLDVT